VLRRRSRIALALAALLAAALGASASLATAAEHVTLHASFSPDRLGASTTIGFGFEIENSTGQAPEPLRGVSLRLPPGIGYLYTTLGLASCEPSALLAHGLAGCSPNSRLGSGSAFVEVPFGSSKGYEIPDIEAVMGPSHDGNIVVLFYADGREPVYAQIVFAGELIAGSAAFGGRLDAAVPLIPSVPEGPDVSIVRVHATIGPAHLTYYEQVHGRTISFHPRGVTVPARCPRGGFRFSASFAFQDDSSTVARTTVPCPRRRRR
jgi:hypothetical protein